MTSFMRNELAHVEAVTFIVGSDLQLMNGHAFAAGGHSRHAPPPSFESMHVRPGDVHSQRQAPLTQEKLLLPLHRGTLAALPGQSAGVVQGPASADAASRSSGSPGAPPSLSHD